MAKITKTPSQTRADYLRTIQNGLINLGVTNPNVSENSDFYVTGTALADQLAPIYNNVEIAADAMMPDTATGSDLDRCLATYGLSRRPPAQASGQITIVTSAPTLVPLGSELTSTIGQVYAVSVGGTYSDGDVIPVTSNDAGAVTNLAKDEILVWTSAPAFTQSTAVVSLAITGGVDAEDDETARARLLSRLQSPPASGNWSHVVEIAESTDPVVQKAFCYPCANGPSTLHIAVAGYPTSVSKSREIDSFKLNAVITPTIQGNLPEYVESVITTVEDVPTDVAFRLTLPLATSALSSLSGPGPGGGWLDPSPYPSVAPTSSNYFCAITVVTDSSHITVASVPGIPPTAGVSRIHWIDRTNWTVKQATISSFTGTGPYALTLDTPFVGVAVNDWIFPASVNAQAYVNAVLQGFKLMGPGEKTDQIGVLPRALRKPRPSSSFPSSIDTQMLKYLTSVGDEVQAADYYYRDITTPAVQAATTVVTPALPSLIGNAPKILVPRNLAFYPPTPLT